MAIGASKKRPIDPILRDTFKVYAEAGSVANGCVISVNGSSATAEAITVALGGLSRNSSAEVIAECEAPNVHSNQFKASSIVFVEAEALNLLEPICEATVDLSCLVTVLTLTQTVAQGVSFFVNSSGTYYLRTGDIGNLTTTESEFMSSLKIQFYLNGLNLIKGEHVTYVTATSFSLSLPLDANDVIKITS